MANLCAADCAPITMGQYLCPAIKHIRINCFRTSADFEEPSQPGDPVALSTWPPAT